MEEGGYTIRIQKYDGTDVLAKAIENQALQVDSDCFSTFYTDKPFIMPNNVRGGVVTSVSGSSMSIDYMYAPGDIVPANTAVILNGDYGGIHNFAVPDDATGARVPAVNYLKGTITEQTITAQSGYLYYKLTYDNDGNNLGFYWGEASGGAFLNGAHKAYLEVPTSITGAKSLSFLDATGINDIRTDKKINDNFTIYSLTGVNLGTDLNSLPSGVYVRGGKKIVKR
jgi:hypothetical protein